MTDQDDAPQRPDASDDSWPFSSPEATFEQPASDPYDYRGTPEYGPYGAVPTNPTTPLPFQPQWEDPDATGPSYAQPYAPGAAPTPPAYPGSYGTYDAPPAGVPYAGPSTHVMERPKKERKPLSRTGFAAAVVVAALVVGGGAGIGGAALFRANDGGSSSASALGTSNVVDEKKSTPVDDSVEKVAADVLPSVVKLDVSGSQEAGSGSGIILSSTGLILTNNHVAAVAGNGGKITVSFNDGSHANATIVGTDPITDVALVQAQGVSGLTPATIGQSSKLQVGEPVVAIGSPFGLAATVTSGIVSALNRPVDVGRDSDGNTTTYPAIQTDAAINPGNSGGPLVDMDGNVVGIDASIQSTGGGDESSGEQSGSIGLGFAIPIDFVLPIIDQIKAGQTPTHAKLGVSVKDAVDSSGAQIVDGATISDVSNGSAASSAGLQDGDVITKVDDTLITSSDSLVATIRSYRPGDKVTVTYERDGQTKTTTLTLDSDGGTTG